MKPDRRTLLNVLFYVWKVITHDSNMLKLNIMGLAKKDWFRYRVAAVIIEDNHILLARSENEADDYYYSVGGGVHLGEKADDAIQEV